MGEKRKTQEGGILKDKKIYIKMLIKVIKGQEVRIKMLKIKNRHTNFVFVIKYHVINKSIYHIRYCLQFLIRFLPTLCPVFNYITRSIVINPLAPNDIYIYRVILSVLDPRKCEYLKDYSLDFEHAYMTTCAKILKKIPAPKG